MAGKKSSSPVLSKLTSDKMRRFPQEYIVDWNATKAAERSGYSPKTARQAGARLLSNVNIQKEIEILQNDLSKRNQVTVDMIVTELKKIAFGNIDDFIDEKGYLKDNFMDIARETMSIVSSIKQKKTVLMGNEDGSSVLEIQTELKLYDKQVALEKLARYLGMYERDNDQRKPQIAQVYVLPGGTKIEF